MNYTEIKDLLLNDNLTATITTETLEILEGGKKNRLQGRITKENRAGIITITKNIGAEFEKRDLEIAKASGHTTAERVRSAQSWGIKLEPDFPIIHHKGNIYLEVFYNTTGDITYFFEGDEVRSEDITGLKQNAKGSDDTGYRRINIENIKELKIA